MRTADTSASEIRERYQKLYSGDQDSEDGR